MKYLGGKTNIKETTATISTLKIELNDIGLIDKLNIKKVINNKGMMFNGNQIILVLGDNALTICDAIKAAS
jgi:phosphotransferase system IIB component